jgi:hypothetical protein
MAATDIFDITINRPWRPCRHAAPDHRSHCCKRAIVTSLQSIASRNANPLESVVVSVTKFIAGSAYNIIPETVELAGTVRTFQPKCAIWPKPGSTTSSVVIAAAHGARPR